MLGIAVATVPVIGSRGLPGGIAAARRGIASLRRWIGGGCGFGRPGLGRGRGGEHPFLDWVGLGVRGVMLARQTGMGVSHPTARRGGLLQAVSVSAVEVAVMDDSSWVADGPGGMIGAWVVVVAVVDSSAVERAAAAAVAVGRIVQ